MNILVDACANINQQTWTVGPFSERSSVNFGQIFYFSFSKETEASYWRRGDLPWINFENLDRNLREITFQLTNVILEWIIFVSQGITVQYFIWLKKGPTCYLSHTTGSKAISYHQFIVHVVLQFGFSSYRHFINNVSMYIIQQWCLDEWKWYEVLVTWYWQRKTMQSKETPSQCHVICHKSQTDCHGIKPKLLQW